jgi:hypothetical protein
VPAEEPRVVEGEDDGRAAGQRREQAEVEVAAVEVVEVEDVGRLREPAEQAARSGIAERLAPPVAVEQPARPGEQVRRVRPPAVEERHGVLVRDLAAPGDQQRAVPRVAVGLEQPVRYARRAATALVRVHLRDGERPRHPISSRRTARMAIVTS